MDRGGHLKPMIHLRTPISRRSSACELTRLLAQLDNRRIGDGGQPEAARVGAQGVNLESALGQLFDHEGGATLAFLRVNAV